MIMERGFVRMDRLVLSASLILFTINMKRGSVKVIFPFSSVWSQAKSFGVSFKAREVLVIRWSCGFDFDVGAKKDGTTRFWSQVMVKRRKGRKQELDNLGLDDE
jgi:hypothetical protein